MVQDERKQIFPEYMVDFILVNNSISRGQLQYTDYLIYTNNSDNVNAETLQSSEKGNKFSSEKNFQKISMTNFFFFYKNKIAFTSLTLWLKKDFALFRE